jgi:hypothetical protein
VTLNLVYTEDRLDELPVGTIVYAHRRLSLYPGSVDVLVRQPNGWFGAWGWEMAVDPEDIVPCTVVAQLDGRR